MNAIVPTNENFPALTGDINEDTSSLLGELTVGNMVIERGWARLYLIWSTKSFLKATATTYSCGVCGLLVTEEEKQCPRCAGNIVSKEEKIFPTLESYVRYIAEESGKSRQTIFNRLGTYRSLSDEKNVNPIKVFALNLVSPGAARKLATADEDQPDIKLVNNSWEETVDAALSFDSKSSALDFIKHDVLNEPKMYAELTGDDEITIYRETYPDDSDILVEDFVVKIAGEWPQDMVEWLSRKLNVRKQK